MATLYKYENKVLQQCVINELLVKLELLKYDIIYNKTEIQDMDSFIFDMLNKYDFVDYDIFQTMSALTTREPHTHNDNEGRMIVKGTGRFYFKFNDINLEIHMNVGDFIVIPAGIIHHFNAIEPIMAIRFFSTKDKNDR